MSDQNKKSWAKRFEKGAKSGDIGKWANVYDRLKSALSSEDKSKSTKKGG